MSVEVSKVSFSYGKVPILKEVSFQAKPGEIFAVMGPNGAGKSTLFRCILGLLAGYQGEILVGGKNIRSQSAGQLARLAAYIPQKSAPAFGYTAEEMVLMGSSVMGEPWRMPGEKERVRAQEALEKLGIEALAKRSFPTLSGGEQQLVLIARALAQQTKVLVMDEPAASLDFGNQVRLFALLKRLAEEGFTVLISLHNPQQVFSYADRVLALEEGTVLDVGRPGNVLTPELLHRLYRVDVSVTDTPFGTAVLPKS